MESVHTNEYYSITLSFVDVEDLVVEKFDDASRYLDCGKWVEAEIIRESIIVKGITANPFYLSMLYFTVYYGNRLDCIIWTCCVLLDV